MPAGCDFICNNNQCSQYKNGFVITAPWPMGKIELIISSLSKSLIVKPLNQSVLDKMIEYKNSGRKYACIIYPNKDNIETAAYRVQLWSPKAKCIWDFDIESNGESLQESIHKSNIPNVCPKTGEPLLNFTEVTKEGINCPFCGEKLQQSRWFTNET
jgi:hypothetical protein